MAAAAELQNSFCSERSCCHSDALRDCSVSIHYNPSGPSGHLPLHKGGSWAGRNLKRLPSGGKLSAELTDEGDIRPLPFKASNTVGRALNERPYGFYRNVFALSVSLR